MSLMKTLAKVAIGVAVAKGVKSFANKAGQQTAQSGNDGLFRGQHSPGASQKPDLGGLENMMDSILGGGAQQGRSAQTGGIGGLLEQLTGQGQPQQQSGGLNDILGQLGGGTAGGLGGLLGGLAKQVQAGQTQNQGIARQTPRGMEQQIYMMSVMGIELDEQAEAQYLHQLASALKLPKEQVNAIHAKLGVPAIYR